MLISHRLTLTRCHISGYDVLILSSIYSFSIKVWSLRFLVTQFLNLDTFDILDQIIICFMGVHCIVGCLETSIFSIYWMPIATSTSVVKIKCLQILSNVTWRQNHPWLKTTAWLSLQCTRECVYSRIFRGMLVFPNFARVKIKNEMSNAAQSKERCPGATQDGDQAPCPRAFLEAELALLSHTSP